MKMESRIHHMTQEFAFMFNDTLRLMQTHIEEATKNYDKEDDGEQLKKFESYDRVGADC